MHTIQRDGYQRSPMLRHRTSKTTGKYSTPMRATSAAALAALALGTHAAPPTTLNLAHWNPHYECFAGAEPACAANATAALTELLLANSGGDGDGALDFVSVIEFEVAGYVPPPGWAAIGGGGASCGYDWVTTRALPSRFDRSSVAVTPPIPDVACRSLVCSRRRPSAAGGRRLAWHRGGCATHRP